MLGPPDRDLGAGEGGGHASSPFLITREESWYCRSRLTCGSRVRSRCCGCVSITKTLLSKITHLAMGPDLLLLR